MPTEPATITVVTPPQWGRPTLTTRFDARSARPHPDRADPWDTSPSAQVTAGLGGRSRPRLQCVRTRRVVSGLLRRGSRLGRQEQPLGDLSVRWAFGDQPQDLQLPTGELAVGSLGPACRAGNAESMVSVKVRRAARSLMAGLVGVGRVVSRIRATSRPGGRVCGHGSLTG